MRHSNVARQVFQDSDFWRRPDQLSGRPAGISKMRLRLQQQSYSYFHIYSTLMPELPDITVYIEALEQRILGHTLVQAQIASVFLVRTIEPPVDALRRAQGFLDSGASANALRLDSITMCGWCLHLMIAGRLHWLRKRRKPMDAAP